jgi:hypothetical protein
LLSLSALNTTPFSSCLPVQETSRSYGSCPVHQYSPIRCHNPSSRSGFMSGGGGGRVSGGSSSTGWPNSRHSRCAMATAAARLNGSHGTAAKGGTWSSTTTGPCAVSPCVFGDNPCPALGCGPAHADTSSDRSKSFFASFFSKKEDSRTL